MTDNNQLDKETYESAKRHLRLALEHMISAGRNVQEFAQFSIDKLGDDFVPYIRKFTSDVRNERITIEGLTQSMKEEIFGRHVSDEKRNEMIREAAYYRAERRGFSGGSEREDWSEATKEVDELLAKEAGLVEKGRKGLVSAASVMEKELDKIKELVESWFESDIKQAPKKKAAAKKATKEKVVTEKEAVTTEPKRITKKKAAVKKKAAAKK